MCVAFWTPDGLGGRVHGGEGLKQEADVSTEQAGEAGWLTSAYGGSPLRLWLSCVCGGLVISRFPETMLGSFVEFLAFCTPHHPYCFDSAARLQLFPSFASERALSLSAFHGMLLPE